MSAVLKVHYSSARQDWGTPRELFERLDREFGFTLDVCATAENAKCPAYFSPEDDGLSQPWSGICWMNPPYGRVIGKWMRKAYEESCQGATVVCLVAARTDTRWWHDYAVKGEIRFLRGRVRFEGAETSAPFPSAVVVFRPVTLSGVPLQRCAHCGQPLQGERSTRKYCGTRCRVAAHRAQWRATA